MKYAMIGVKIRDANLQYVIISRYMLHLFKQTWITHLQILNKWNV